MPANSDLPVEFGTMLRRRVPGCGLSLNELAEQVGISRQYLHRLLKGQVAAPSIATLHGLATRLALPPHSFYRYFEPPGSDVRGSQHGLWRSPTDPEDAVSFVSDHDCPDLALVHPGERFTKRWSVRNAGSRPWLGRRLQRCDAEVVLAERTAAGTLIPLGQLSLSCAVRYLSMPNVAPGEVITLALDFVAPAEPCTAVSVWQMVDAQALRCFSNRFFLQTLVTVVAP